MATAMSKAKTHATSEEARKDGNSLFLARDFQQALQAYQRASELDPDDWRPAWNESAVYFELGDYKTTAETTKKVLEHSQSLEARDRQKMLTRLVKALLFTKQYTEAEKYIATLNEGSDRSTLEKLTQDGSNTYELATSSTVHKSRIRGLPYTKPNMDDVAEFYSVGHDMPGSMFDHRLIKASSPSETLSLFFGGIGDARHFFQTIIAIHLFEGPDPVGYKYHMTINDLKPEVFARDLIFFLLLEQLAADLPSDNESFLPELLPENAKIALLTLVYAYVAQIMPPEVYDNMQRVMTLAIDTLRGEHQLPSWLDVASPHRAAVISALENWRSEFAQQLSTAKFMASARTANLLYDDPGASKGIKAEIRQYRESALILPPESAIHANLRAILDLPLGSSRSAKLRRYLTDTWRPNVTLVDVNWILQGDSFRPGRDLLDVAHDPFDLVHRLYEAAIPIIPTKSTRLFDHVSKFFVDSAKSLRGVRNRLQVEWLPGDIAHTLEAIRRGLLTDRILAYPTTYDRIHASNIPDYIGGSLFHYIFTLPMLKRKKSSLACSNVLRNPPAFPTLAHFDTEYALLPDAAAVRQAFGAQSKPLEEIEDTFYQQARQLTGGPLDDMLAHLEQSPFALKDYYGWQLTGHGAKADLNSLRDRPTTEKWLYAMFLKFCYPPVRTVWQDPMLVAYPLNLTIFFRLLSALHDRGYPAHWLADVLSSILDNQVHATARPPRSYPYSIKECNKTFANKRINIMPFVPEMRTLTALWLSELPFGLAQQPAPPTLNKIRRYSVHFTSTRWNGVTSMSVFNLMFAKANPLESIMARSTVKFGPSHFRSLLLFDEKQDTSPEARALRTNCAIVSTWYWHANEERGTFWMDEDTMETWLEEGDWRVTILRQDSWHLCAMPEALGTTLRKEEFWVDRI